MNSRARFKPAALAIILLMLLRAISEANELKPDTLSAWEEYVADARAQMQQRAKGQAPFLWVSETPDRMQRVQRGEILIARTDRNGPSKVPHGMIHDWTSAIFVPRAKLAAVMQVLDDYDHYQDFYKPQVAQSKLLDRSQDREQIQLLMTQGAYGITAAVEIDDDVEIIRPGPTRAYTFSQSMHVREIANYGRSNQEQLPEDRGPGYVWRIFTVTRLEERDGGVYVEQQTVEMSRGIPIEFRFMIKPLTEHLARSIMLTTMNDTQKAILGKMDADSTRQSHTAPEQGVREQVNQGIRGPTVFNRVIDFDRTLRVRGRSHHLLASYQSKDPIHSSAARYETMAEAVNRPLFDSRAAGARTLAHK